MTFIADPRETCSVCAGDTVLRSENKRLAADAQALADVRTLDAYGPSKRIGPQMQHAVSIVSQEPGVVPYSVAKRLHIGAAKGTDNALGYNPINRAMAAGLLVCYPCPQNRSRSRLLTAEQDAALSALTAFARAC